MQRRTGKLPKTPEVESVSRAGYFGYSHRSWGGSKPTPRYEGFFGIGSGWYGNDDFAQDNLPVNGFYGATEQDDDILDAYLNGHYLQLGDGEAPTPDEGTKGIFQNDVSVSEGFILSQSTLLIGAGLTVLWWVSRK